MLNGWLSQFSAATAKFHPMGLVRFPANSLSPLFFQLLEATPGVMAKTIQHLQSALGF
jgi:hypothetical protein